MTDNISRGEGHVMLLMAGMQLKEPGVKIIPLGTKDGLEMIGFYPKSPYTKFSIVMRDEEEIVGVLTVGQFHNTVDGVYLHPLYRGRGFGMPMYLGALHVLKEIRSSIDLGIMAVKTWYKLSRYAKVGMIDWNNREHIDFTWGPNGIPEVDGSPINKGANLKREFIFTAKGR